MIARLLTLLVSLELTTFGMGLSVFTNWNGALALSSTEPVHVVIVGDSWGIGHYFTILEADLRVRYGNAGMGFVPALTNYGDYYQHCHTGVSIAYAGTWTNDIAGVSPYPPIAFPQARTGDTVTPAKQTLITPFVSFDIMYHQTNGAGVFRYRLDSGTWTNIDTAGTSTFSTTNIAAAYGSHTVEVELVSGEVSLLGYMVRTNSSGLLFWNSSTAGMTSNHLMTGETNLWRQAWSWFNPRMSCYVLGVNDTVVDLTPATVRANASNLVSLLKATGSNDVLIVSQYDIQHGTPTQMAATVGALQSAAADTSAYYVNGFAIAPVWADAITAGIMIDAAHPTTYGSQLLANLIAGLLRAPTWNINTVRSGKLGKAP